MATYFKLKFDAHDVQSTEGSSWVLLGDHSRDADGWPVLTPQCASITELEWHVREMQADLNELLKEARREYVGARKERAQPN
jgi:hypothetical protein